MVGTALRFASRDRSTLLASLLTLPIDRSIPRHLVAGEHLAHARDQVALWHRELRLGLLLPIFIVVLAQAGKLGAERQILDLHFAPSLLVAALDHDAGRAPLVGIFHLRAEFSRPEIELGANIGGAQRLHHLLVVADAILIEHGDHHRSVRGLGVGLADQLQCRHQPRHADREPGRRHRLAAKARHEAIIASATADRAEAHRAAGLILGLERELHLVDWAGVILEAADDRGIYSNAIVAISGALDDFNHLS